jgi:DNA-binding NtrC family response regulator
MTTQLGILSGLHVLVVDDRPDITSLVGEVLADEGALAVPANSGAAAIALTMLVKFDLVILDLAMPQPDGLKILDFIKATDPNLLRRTLVLTGQSFGGPAMSKLAALNVPYLSKPFQLDALVETVSRMSLPGLTLQAAA